MSLESILIPFKFADEQVSRQYAKLVKKFDLDTNRRKYKIGLGLDLTFDFLSFHYGTKLIGELANPLFISLSSFDGSYNLAGILGRFEEGRYPNLAPVNLAYETYKQPNSFLRLPVFLAGISLISKVGYDLYNNIVNGESLDQNSFNYLNYGLGFISLASSMYIKDSDPKLLDKDSVWKKVYDKIKFKLPSLAPTPLHNQL